MFVVIGKFIFSIGYVLEINNFGKAKQGSNEVVN